MKKYIYLIFMLMPTVILSSCKKEEIKAPTEETSQSTSTELLGINTYSGEAKILNELISVPVIFENASEYPEIINSKQIFLKDGDKSYPLFEIKGQPGDFKMPIGKKKFWYSTFTFFVGDESFNKKRASDLRVIYRNEDGVESQSKKFSEDYIKKNGKIFLKIPDTIELSGYYRNVLTSEEKQQPSKYTKNDDQYLNLQTIIVKSENKKFSDNLVMIYIYNPTKKPMTFSYSTIQLQNRNGTDIDVSESSRQENIFIPAEKSVAALIAFESEINEQDGPYKVRFIDENSGNGKLDTELLKKPLKVAFTESDSSIFHVNPANVVGPNQEVIFNASISGNKLILDIKNNSLFEVQLESPYLYLKDLENNKKYGVKYQDSRFIPAKHQERIEFDLDGNINDLSNSLSLFEDNYCLVKSFKRF